LCLMKLILISSSKLGVKNGEINDFHQYGE